MKSYCLLTSCVTAALLLASGAPLRAEKPSPAKTFDVQAVRDVPYYDGDDADKTKHKLDLYLPKGQKDFPVLFFVHGGAWMTGDKNFFGVYSSFGKQFARHGIGAVVTNYRLSPGVQHPEHIKDVARAFAWTHKNIAGYGGRPAHIFLCGHSAGAHLVALLATDATYLKAVGESLSAIRGVIPISGVYQVPDKLLSSVFGKSPEVHKKASPIMHVRKDAPPFLILYADNDFPTCDFMSERFGKALKAKKAEAKTVEIKKRNHVTIILSASGDGDPVAREILDFIDHRTADTFRASATGRQ